MVKNSYTTVVNINPMINKKKIAVIHIIKKELNLSDKEYRTILKEAAGVTSAKELDDMTFRKLMNYFVRSKHYRRNIKGLTLRQKMFIKGLLQQLQWKEEHLKNFIHKYYHTYRIESLSRKEAVKLIESLKNVLAHQMKPNEEQKSVNL